MIVLFCYLIGLFCYVINLAQLFFIAMGQTWCEKQKKAGELAALLTGLKRPII